MGAQHGHGFSRLECSRARGNGLIVVAAVTGREPPGASVALAPAQGKECED